MDFTAFAEMVTNRLELVTNVAMEPSTGLFDDLGIDSFQAFQMLIIIETAADLIVPPPYLPEMFTLGDAYEYFLEAQRLANA